MWMTGAFGGGPGMVLQIQPIYDCLKAIKAFPPFQGGERKGFAFNCGQSQRTATPCSPLSKGAGERQKQNYYS